MALENKRNSLTLKKKIGIISIAGIICASVFITIAFSSLMAPPQDSSPGVFTLSSDAGSPDPDGAFVLSWTAANDADNYTIYEHSSYIFAINGSLLSLGAATGGVYYYVILAENAAGNTTSNCVMVTVGWNAWTWMDGNSTINLHGVYGIKNTPSPDNCPGGRTGAATWTDNLGNLWLFGGEGYGETGNIGPLQDLWWYNVTSLEWTWMGGQKITNAAGDWGQKGVPAASNLPGPRYGSAAWKDTSGNCWLFGGWGYISPSSGAYNDVWRLNTTSLEWTWMNGSSGLNNFGYYGTKGTANQANTPGGRYGCGSNQDANGNLWLFGGSGYNGTGVYGYIDEVWLFNFSLCTWTWVNGSGLTDQFGKYGIKDTANGLNNPGGRYGCKFWSDSNGKAWLFGGYGRGESGSAGYLNDIWSFNKTSFQWTWVNGSKLVNQYGIYGVPGISNPANTPGGRYSTSTWSKMDGTFWLLGGWGNGENGSANYLNDVWRFDVASAEWTWMGGSKSTLAAGAPGELGIPSSENHLSARGSSASWIGLGGELWLFSGYGKGGTSVNGYLSDMWRYYP
jgi:hypothetical protein